MQYLKNVLLVAIFALFSFGLEAAAPISFSFTQNAVSASLAGEGVVNIVQERNGVRVEVITEGLVNLTVLDKNGNVVYTRSLDPQVRRANINTKNYADGVYTLIAETAVEVQTVNFSISGK